MKSEAIVCIDVWDAQTFDDEILEWLGTKKPTICGYLDAERQRNAEYAKQERWALLPPNQYGDAFMVAREALGAIMSKKTARVFHYSRMTDDEVDALLSDGIVPTSLEFLKARIARQVASGIISQKEGDAVYAKSPLHSTGFGVRKGFWTTTTPFPPTSIAVRLLVGHWGGESAYWLFTGEGDQDMIGRLQGIGRGRIFEIAMPLADANKGSAGFSVGDCIIKEYARTLGYEVHPEGRDIYVEHGLSAASVLKVHSEGDQTYGQFGKGYPPNYTEPE